VRFVFCKTDDVLHEAARRLRTLGAVGTRRERAGAESHTLEAARRSGLQR
jgi:hypothetical protein